MGEKKKKKLKWWQIVLIVVVAIGVIGAIGGGGDKKSSESHIYDNARDVDAHTGSGDVNGKISLIEVKSDECTDEALIDWYNNYVEKNGDEYNYFIIKYTDKDNEGIWTTKGNLISKDVKLDEFNGNKDEYEMSDSSNSTSYIVKDGKLEVME